MVHITPSETIVPRTAKVSLGTANVRLSDDKHESLVIHNGFFFAYSGESEI